MSVYEDEYVDSNDGLFYDEEISLKNNFDLTINKSVDVVNSYSSDENSDDGNELSHHPLRKAVSCSTCVLCQTTNPNIERNTNGGFALRKVASCSICTWDLDDKFFEDKFDKDSSLSDNETDSLEENKNDEKDNFDIPRLKRSNSYAEAMNESSLNLNDDDNDEENNNNALILNTLRVEKINNDHFLDTYRSPPDGGETYEKLIFEENKKTPGKINEKSTKNNLKKNISERKKLKGKTQSSLDRKATQELDEIFGKIKKTPPASVQASFDEETDRFNVNNDLFHSVESFSSTGKKPRLSLKRLLPPRSLFSKKHGNLTNQRSRSVEFLHANEYAPPSNLMKSLSSMEIVTCGLESDNEDYDVPENINEKWITYLNRIGGMSIFGGNESLRYVWYQISCFQNDLLQLFEDFMKSIIEEFQQAYMKCQELECHLTLKTEQQEKKTTKIYEEVEMIIQQERQQMQEKHLEKEEQTRHEFVTLLESKETELQDMTRKCTEQQEQIDKLQKAISEENVANENISSQHAHLIEVEGKLRSENRALEEEISKMHQQLAEDAILKKEMQENIDHMSKIADIEKENYKQCLRQFQDLMEEKEYLDVSLNNISSEVNELKYQNKSLLEQQNNWSLASIHNERPISSPAFDSNIDENGNPNLHFKRAISPVSTCSKTSSSSFPEESRPITPVIQSPSGLTPIRPRVPSFERNPALTSSARRQLYDSSSNTPVKLASTIQTEYKVIFVGDANVGKTSLIRRIAHGKYRPGRKTTIEPDCSSKVLQYNDQEVKLKLWDTVGQERFNSIPPAYFRKADVVILMYDIIEDLTFINARTWIKTIHENTNENIFLILVANKVDIDHQRRIPISKGKLLAKDHDAMFIETSAKSGENVNTLCDMIASTLLDREDTVVIRNNYDSHLCSLSYSQKRYQSKSICC